VTPKFCQQTLANDDLIALAARDNGNGGSGRHGFGMRGDGFERKLDFRAGDRSRFSDNHYTMPDEISPPPSPPDPSSSAGLEPNVAAGLSCVLLLIGGIIFLILEKKNEFVRYWAAQSVVVGGVMFAFWIAFSILVQILVHIPIIGWLFVLLLWLLSVAVSIGTLVVWIIMLINSFGGKRWDVPYLSKYVPMVLGWFKTT
jgi:uncharacterized membrane protein